MAFHCSLLSFTTRRRSTALFKHVHRFDTICVDELVFTGFHSAYTGLLVMLPQIAAASGNMKTPESEEKFRWVKCGFLTKACKQSKTPCTSSLIATRPQLTTKFSPCVTRPLVPNFANTKLEERYG